MTSAMCQEQTSELVASPAARPNRTMMISARLIMRSVNIRSVIGLARAQFPFLLVQRKSLRFCANCITACHKNHHPKSSRKVRVSIPEHGRTCHIGGTRCCDRAQEPIRSLQARVAATARRSTPSAALRFLRCCSREQESYLRQIQSPHCRALLARPASLARRVIALSRS